jgi:predicted NAD/FAD-binding protein
MGKIFSDAIQQDIYSLISFVLLTNVHNASEVDRTVKNAFRKYMYNTLGHVVHLDGSLAPLKRLSSSSILEVVGKVLHCFILVKYSINTLQLIALKLIFNDILKNTKQLNITKNTAEIKI